jgi:hypothetical protein
MSLHTWYFTVLTLAPAACRDRWFSERRSRLKKSSSGLRSAYKLLEVLVSALTDLGLCCRLELGFAVALLLTKLKLCSSRPIVEIEHILLEDRHIKQLL